MIPQRQKGRNIKTNPAFSLIEILLAIAIIGTLVAIAVPSVSAAVNKARIKRACADIAAIGAKIEGFYSDFGYLPATIDDIEVVNRDDPWGNPYEYLIILGRKKNEVEGKWRQDRFLVPINSDFDLYSMGSDEDSRPPLTAQVSHDDIVRANNGNYIGVASKY